MFKVYVENNYFFVQDATALYEGLKKDVRVNISSKTEPDPKVSFSNLKGWNSEKTINFSQIVDENDDPFADIQSFVDFYTLNTGNFNGGGSAPTQEEVVSGSGTTELDFSFDGFSKTTQTGNIDFTGINTSGIKKIEKTILIQGSNNLSHTITFPNTWKNISGILPDPLKNNFIEIVLINGEIIYSINKYESPDIIAPTLIKSSILVASLNTIELLYSEPLDESITTNNAWFTVAGKTISSVVITSNKVRIIVTAPFSETDNPLVTFTNQVSGDGIQDANGNKTLDFSQNIGLITYRFDNFDRANSTTSINSPSDSGSNWVTPFGAVWGIDTNKAYCFGANTVTNTGHAVYLETGESDVTLRTRFTFGTSGTNASTGILFRFVDSNNYYVAQFARLSTNQLTYSLMKWTGGTLITLISTTVFGTWTSGFEYHFFVRLNEDTITLYNNTIVLAQFTDGDHHGTKHGLRIYAGAGSTGNTDRFDNFGAYYG